MASTKQSPKPRPTAAERREQQTVARQEQEARNAAALVEFEKARPTVWLGLWSKAMRLALLLSDYPEFSEAHPWWFQHFRIQANTEQFRIENTGPQFISKSTLQLSQVSPIDQALGEALGWYGEFIAAKERERLAELELARQRAEALAKLTEEDRRVLGLSHR